MAEDCFGIFLSFYIYCFLKQIRIHAGYYKEKSKFEINQILVALDNLEHLFYYLTFSQKMCLQIIIYKWGLG